MPSASPKALWGLDRAPHDPGVMWQWGAQTRVGGAILPLLCLAPGAFALPDPPGTPLLLGPVSTNVGSQGPRVRVKIRHVLSSLIPSSPWPDPPRSCPKRSPPPEHPPAILSHSLRHLSHHSPSLSRDWSQHRQAHCCADAAGSQVGTNMPYATLLCRSPVLAEPDFRIGLWNCYFVEFG